MTKSLLGLTIVSVFGFVLMGCQPNSVQKETQASLASASVSKSSIFLDGNYTLLPKNSRLFWEGKKLVGGGHEGFVPLKSGTLQQKDGSVSGRFVLDMAALQATDTDSQKLHDHLRAEDFFDTETYPEATFVVQQLQKESSKWMIRGTLQLKSFSHELVFPVKMTPKGTVFLFSGETILDRRDWEIGNPLLQNEIPIGIDIVMERNVEEEI
ncbi:MAG: YceI family protein [Candidatus Gracilibacteria bacterium]|nr:YceI family protein [Candidatus Gracilibacteria bacterium]